MGMKIWFSFFLLLLLGGSAVLAEVPKASQPASGSLAANIKDKRIYFLPPKDAPVPIGFKTAKLFLQFGADGGVQTGMIMVNGKAFPAGPRGKYVVDELTVVMTRPAGRTGDTPDNPARLAFPKAEPAEGDLLSLINATGKKETLTITKVEAAKPLSKPPSRDSFEMLLLAGDKNGDGKLSREEGSFFPAWKKGFDRFDTNEDGFVDEAEFEAAKADK